MNPAIEHRPAERVETLRALRPAARERAEDLGERL
jgi:hypothetical protein